jgi:hypothetical protein
VDEIFGWSGAYNDSFLNNDFVALDAIAFALEDLSDTGPYEVYIDNLVNGTTFIQGFETATNAEPAVMIALPNFSSTTTPYLLSPAPGAISPNVSIVTNRNASAGSQSLLISWQFKDSSAQDWFRAAFQGTKTPNPVVDLRQPISFDILMLPAGQTAANASVSLLTNLSLNPGANATFGVTTTGAGPFTYAWKLNGTDVPNNSGSTLTLNNVQLTDNDALVSVTVKNGSCDIIRRARLTVTESFSLTVTRSADTLQISFPIGAGDTARLQKTASLIPPITWQPVDVVPVNGGTAYTVSVPIQTTGAEYFRLQIPTP